MTKKITESLVSKKPATASKLFAEGMEARLDEISKKTLGSYVKKAAYDVGEIAKKEERARAARSGLPGTLNFDRKETGEAIWNAVHAFDKEADKHSNKKYKRQSGIHTAIKKLTKEDLDESVDESYKSHPFYQKHFMHSDHAEGSSEIHHHDKQDADGTYHHFMIMQVGPNNLHTASIRSSKGNKDHIGTGHGYTPHEAIDRALKEYHGSFDDATHLKEENSPAHLSEVEAPANFWNAGMAKMNPIQVSQKQPAEPGQFKATLTKSPKRLADQDSSLEGKPRTVRDETEATAASRGPKTIELTGDWHADVPDHQFDPKLDSETEYYPLFSQFKSLGAYPSGPARAWESEEIDEDELNEISKELVKRYSGKAQANLSRHADEIDKLGAKADYHHDRAEHYIHNLKSGDREKFLKHQTTADTLENKISKEYSIIRKREKGLNRATKKLSEDELNEISKKALAKYIRGASTSMMAAGIGIAKATPNSQEQEKEARKISKRVMGIDRATKKLSEEGKKKPSEFKKFHDKHETEVKAKMKELGEETLNEISKKTSSLKKFKVYTPKYDTHVIVKAKNKDEAHREACRTSGSAYERPDVKITRVPDETLEEGLFDPAKQPLLGLWDEHARRSDAHGSGSRNEILKRIEDHVAKKHGQEGLKKMKLHTDLTNALKHSLSPDKGHLQAILGNMRSRCAMGV